MIWFTSSYWLVSAYRGAGGQVVIAIICSLVIYVDPDCHIKGLHLIHAIIINKSF